MLFVNEIFTSIQGEGPNIGRKCLFIRFTGCNLSCPFCDTENTKGTITEIDGLMKAVSTYKGKYIVLTGGEPLLQRTLPDLIQQIILFDNEITIGIETNGTQALVPLQRFSKNISLTVSPKVDNGNPHELHPDYFSLIGTATCQWKETTIKLLHPAYCLYGHEYDNMDFDHFFVQPIYPKNGTPNYHVVIDTLHIYSNKWRLSPQLHKLIGVR